MKISLHEEDRAAAVSPHPFQQMDGPDTLPRVLSLGYESTVFERCCRSIA
jgi:hypothetical protein